MDVRRTSANGGRSLLIALLICFVLIISKGQSSTWFMTRNPSQIWRHKVHIATPVHVPTSSGMEDGNHFIPVADNADLPTNLLAYKQVHPQLPGNNLLHLSLWALTSFVMAFVAFSKFYKVPMKPSVTAQALQSWALQAASGVNEDAVIDVKANVTDAGDRQLGFGSTTTESSQERQTLFNGIAPVYDLLNDALSLGQHRLWKLQTVAWTDAPLGAHVLDLCCGSGDLAMLMALKVGPSGKVSAVDFAADMLQKGRDRVNAPLNGIPRLLSAPIDWIQADALLLPFPNDTFGAATMGYGLRNVVSIPDALTELRRVLQPGAKAALLDFHRPSNGVVAAFQKLYLDNLVVPAATIAGLEKEYEYIMPSLEAFPTGPEQEKLALAAGFRKATHHEIAAGLMGCLVVVK